MRRTRREPTSVTCSWDDTHCRSALGTADRRGVMTAALAAYTAYGVDGPGSSPENAAPFARGCQLAMRSLASPAALRQERRTWMRPLVRGSLVVVLLLAGANALAPVSRAQRPIDKINHVIVIY